MADSKIMVVPSLSEDGFISDLNLILKTLVKYFMVSESLQSNTYRGNIKSLKKLVMNYGTDPDNLQIQIKSELTEMLKDYFYSTSITCEAKFSDDSSVSSEIGLEIIARDANGVDYEYGNVVEINDDDWALKEAIEDLYIK